MTFIILQKTSISNQHIRIFSEGSRDFADKSNFSFAFTEQMTLRQTDIENSYLILKKCSLGEHHII